MTSTAPAQVEVVRVGSQHLTALAEFYRQVWDPEATAETVAAGRRQAAAANPVTPGEPPPTWLVLRAGRAMGHVTTIPLKVWLEDEEHPAHWVKGLWVLPEFQRSAAGFLVLKEAVKALPSALALVHEPAARRLFEALGFTDFGSLPNALRVLRTRPLLERLDFDQLGLGGVPSWMRLAARMTSPLAPVLGPIGDAAMAGWAGLRTGLLTGMAIEVATALDAEGADVLWQTVRQEMKAAPVRSGAALAHRYVGDPDYRFVHVRSRHDLIGLGIVRRPSDTGDPRLGGVRVATLADLLYSPSQPRAGLALLRGAERAARLDHADALLCGASASSVRPLLGRRGYVRIPANLHVLGRFADGPKVPSGIVDWWFTRGDSGGDGSF